MNLDCKNSWKKNYKFLKNYVTENNKLPEETTIYNEINLGKWTYEQREQYKKKNIPIKNRLELEKIYGWWWSSEYMRDDWKDKYNLLKKYVKKNKKIPLQRIKYKDIALGTWCNTQRRSYKRKQLMNYKIKMLEKIDGWFWTLYSKWHLTFKLITEYIDKNKKIPIGNTIYKNKKIGNWCIVQRQKFKNNKLSQNKINLLENINLWKWKTRKYNSKKKHL
jgi:ribosomal protein S18